MREHHVSVDNVSTFVEILLDKCDPLLFLRCEEFLLRVVRRRALGTSPGGDTIDVMLA